jgi:hypothetical protein
MDTVIANTSKAESTLQKKHAAICLPSCQRGKCHGHDSDCEREY